MRNKMIIAMSLVVAGVMTYLMFEERDHLFLYRPVTLGMVSGNVYRLV